ncbi:hypothetical protein BB561_000412 [Smittium simulii]|uniref:Reverse transcriptase domain-containing protein n=1 Tax=Smittium simulii TaxID=133385 RepID=A0A2T9YZC5_9FUNG|nr:hypothetical protein BB561_000412 [Smittium simulii]
MSFYLIYLKSGKDSRTGRGFAPILNGPVLDTDGNLIIEQNQKLLVWAKHFAGLAEDSNEKKKVWNSSSDVLPECNDIITWEKIKIALKATSNNKAAGIDGLSKIPERWTTSIVLAVPTKGASLIQINIEICQKYSILVKEQANFGKAYDEVLHQAIINKMQYVGIGGPEMTVMIGYKCSNTVQYNCGAYQRRPLSPILFDMYINEIFKNLNGVEVPSIESKIPSLLFADDAVVLVKYTYLGLTFEDSWKWDETIINNRNKMIKAMYGTYSFLKNQNTPAAIRLKVLQSVLIPIGTYGGELFGMTDKSLRLIPNVSKATAINRLRTEFGISLINSICSRARERAYFKWPISKTWISDLIRQPLKSRSSTWQKMPSSSNWISLQLLYPELRIGLNMVGKIQTELYWTIEQLAKSQFISKIYRKKCPCCNTNVSENIEHILIDCKRWAAIRTEKIG